MILGLSREWRGERLVICCDSEVSEGGLRVCDP